MISSSQPGKDHHNQLYSTVETRGLQNPTAPPAKPQRLLRLQQPNLDRAEPAYHGINGNTVHSKPYQTLEASAGFIDNHNGNLNVLNRPNEWLCYYQSMAFKTPELVKIDLINVLLKECIEISCNETINSDRNV